MNMLVIGFDPGGVSQFGWCVAEARPDRLLRFSRSGVANHAAEAVPAALEKIGDAGQIAAVGIDSPLFWVASGKRRADRAVRAAMNRLGARNIGGTVQQLNSLRGACIVQGIMAARLLRTAVPTVGITESHPKALLWLLKIANNQRRVAEVTMAHLSELITSDSRHLSEHERDAALVQLRRGRWSLSRVAGETYSWTRRRRLPRSRPSNTGCQLAALPPNR